MDDAAGTQPEGLGLLTRTRLLALMAEFGLEPHRTLGQNFVVDQNTIRKIVRLSGVGDADRVIEIGPGLGSLTLGLLEAGASVTAVEIDQRLIAPLEMVTEGRATVVQADATRLDWNELADGGDATIVANLPYNVATPVVLRLLDEAPWVTKLVVMVQREVGERLVAGPGTKAYGIPSVKSAFWASGRLIGTVGAEVFHPQPRVTSALVELRRRASPLSDVDPETLFELVRSGFGQRRKTLRRSVGAAVPAEAFELAGISASARAEELDPEMWCRLAEAVVEARKGGSLVGPR